MYAKLALRNMERSMKNYLIYSITVVMTVMLLYSFLALGFSKDILSMSENMPMLTSQIGVLSVMVALVSSFVISHAIRYILNQRKKELATYELLGMEIRTIQKLFLMENIFLGTAAFLLGTMLGTGVSGLLALIVKNIFDIQREYRVIFSLKAFGYTFLLFLMMYGVGIVRAVRMIRRQKIVELLYDNRKNEEVPKISIFQSTGIICLSVLLVVIGLLFLKKGMNGQSNEVWLYFAAAIILILTGVYGIYKNFPHILVILSKRSSRLIYSNTNLFFLGQIGRRIQSCGRLLAVTAILLTLSLATMFIGLAMGGGYKANIEVYYPYDAGIAIDAPLTRESFSPVVSFVDEHSTVTDSVVFYLYEAGDYPIEALAFSDYNHLRSILGFAPVELPKDQYLVHCDTWTCQEQIKTALTEQSWIKLAGNTLDNPQRYIYTEPMEQYQMAGTNGYVLVVPDSVAEELSEAKIRAIMKLENGGYADLKNEIKYFLNDLTAWQPKSLTGTLTPENISYGVSVKAWGTANSLTGYTTISFCGLYLSMVLIILSCTILAFEQLSVIDTNRKNYRIIDEMGVSKSRQKHLMHQELATFFFIPLVLPVLVTVILIGGAQNLFGEYIMQPGIFYGYGAVSLAGFGIIYFIYYGATAYLFKRSMGMEG